MTKQKTNIKIITVTINSCPQCDNTLVALSTGEEYTFDSFYQHNDLAELLVVIGAEVVSQTTKDCDDCRDPCKCGCKHCCDD